MKLLEIYEGVLSCGYLIVQDGYINGKIGEDIRPATIKSKRLVLPTPEHLREPDGKTFFHPLNENLVGSVDPALDKFRVLLVSRINQLLGTLVYTLFDLAASTAEHGKLTPPQSEVMIHMKGADEKSVKDLKKLLSEMPINDANKGFIHAFLRRGPTVNGKKYARGLIASFPLYEDLEVGNKAYGVDFRVKDAKAIKTLLEYLIPGIAEKHSYSVLSDSDVAPYAMAMFGFTVKICKRLNEVTTLFESVLGKDFERFNLEWADAYKDLKALLPEIRRIPILSQTSDSEEQRVVTPAVEPAKPVSGPTVVGEPLGIAAPAAPAVPVEQRRGPIPLRDLMPPPPSTTIAQPLYQQPVVPVYQQPVQNHLVAGFQTPAPTQVERTNKGVVLDSLIRTNPALMAKVAVNAPIQQTAHVQPWNPDGHFPPAPAAGYSGISGYGGGGGGYQGGGV